jgi:hypothetical protein
MKRTNDVDDNGWILENTSFDIEADSRFLDSPSSPSPFSHEGAKGSRISYSKSLYPCGRGI